MSTNKKFTGEWVLRNAWDDDQKALKVASNPSETEITISAESDSIQIKAMGFVITDTNPVSCVGMSKCALYVVAPTEATVQVSPSDSDDFWIDLPGITNNICARRIRVSAAADTKFYLVVQA